MSHPTLPLRRSRTLAALKTVQSDEITKLQAKNQAEVDLLDDIRNFSKQRSSIEKEYAQGMLRIIGQFMQKHGNANGSGANANDGCNRSASAVWKTLLEESEGVYRRRLAIAEQLLAQVSEMSKAQKLIKVQLFKKCQDLGNQLHGEMQQSIKEVTKAKKSYRELESVAAAARKSYHDAESRKTKKMKLFKSKSQLEKKATQAENKLELCEKRATIARNEYILSLAAVNAHQERYYSVDLPQLVKTADGDVFSRFQEAFTISAKLELDAARNALTGYKNLLDHADMVSRDFDLKCFLSRNGQFLKWKRYEMDPHRDDPIREILKGHEGEVVLNKEARKLANRILRENRTIKDKNKAIRGLQSVSTAYSKTPEFGTLDAQFEVEQQADELHNAIRKSEIQKLKAEGMLEVLRSAGVDVDQWMKSADITASRENLLDVAESSLSGSVVSLDNSDAGILSDDEQNYLDFSSGDEFDGEGPATYEDDQMSAVTDFQHFYHVVLYDYTATKDDELSIQEGENITVLESDGSGWCKGRNSNGQEGFFPESYVSPVQDNLSPRTDDVTSQFDETLTDRKEDLRRAIYNYEATSVEELSFPTGAVIKLLRTDTGVDDGWWEGYYNGAVGVFPSILVERINKGTSTLSDDSPSPTTFPPPPVPPPALTPTVAPPEPSILIPRNQVSIPPEIAVTPPEKHNQYYYPSATLSSSKSSPVLSSPGKRPRANSLSSSAEQSPRVGRIPRVRSATEVGKEAARRSKSVRPTHPPPQPPPMESIPDFDQFIDGHESYV